VDPLTDPPAGNVATPPPLLTTERLVLRSWTDADEEALFRLSDDREAMAYFADLPGREQIRAMVHRHRDALEQGRPGLYAVQVRPGNPLAGEFIGFVGLAVPTFEAPFMPCVEIGWRLRRTAWGHGYATEAARACLQHAFTTLRLREVVSFTAVPNEPSRAVMRRLGMRHTPEDDFLHPNIAPGHPLRRHVFYRLTADEWSAAALD
jgi:RimJ/RimL family protein N-acetyltransferase